MEEEEVNINMIKLYISSKDKKILTTARGVTSSGDDNYNAKEDRKLGRVGERLAIQFMLLRGFKVVGITSKIKNNHFLYDVKYIKDGVVRTQEVKIDRFTSKGCIMTLRNGDIANIPKQDSGNIFIELSQNIFEIEVLEDGRKVIATDDRGRFKVELEYESGLSKTVADDFVTFMYGAVQEIWVANTKKLKESIKNLLESGEITKIHCVGENHKSNGVSLCREKYKHLFDEVIPFELNEIDEYPEELKQLFEKLFIEETD